MKKNGILKNIILTEGIMNMRHFNLFLCLFSCILFFSGCTAIKDSYTKDEVDNKLNGINNNTVKLIGWGTIMANGTILSGSGNFTCTRSSTGNYTITWKNGILTNYYEYIFSAIPYTTAQNIAITYATGNSGALVYFTSFTTNTGSPTDIVFNFNVMSKN
jgi:hypothetical protein